MQVDPRGPFLREVTLKEAFLHDLPCFLVGFVWIVMLACLASLVILVSWLGAPPPRESPGEIFFGIALVTGMVFVFLRYRAARITEILKSGEPVTAEVLRGLAVQLYAQIQLRYMLAGRVVEVRLWLPNTKRPRAASQARQLSLVVPPGRTRGGVVRDLYP